MVSASKKAFDEDEIDRIHTFPPNAITVEHDLVRQVSGRRSEKSGKDEQIYIGSEEDLFREC